MRKLPIIASVLLPFFATSNPCCSSDLVKRNPFHYDSSYDKNYFSKTVPADEIRSKKHVIIKNEYNLALTDQERFLINNLNYLWSALNEQDSINSLRKKLVTKSVIPSDFLDNFLLNWKAGTKIKLEDSLYLEGEYFPNLVEKKFNPFVGNSQKNNSLLISKRISQFQKNSLLSNEERKKLLTSYFGLLNKVEISYKKYTSDFRTFKKLKDELSTNTNTKFAALKISAKKHAEKQLFQSRQNLISIVGVDCLNTIESKLR